MTKLIAQKAKKSHSKLEIIFKRLAVAFIAFLNRQSGHSTLFF
jgi:hypothetical protein